MGDGQPASPRLLTASPRVAPSPIRLLMPSLLISHRRALRANLPDQVPHDHTIQDQNRNPSECHPPCDLKNLKRHQQRRSNNRQVFRPMLLLYKTESLGQYESGVHKRPGTDRTQSVIVYKKKLVQEFVHVLVVRIDVDGFDNYFYTSP